MPRDTEPREGVQMWVDADVAVDIYATAMTRRDENEACLNEEETKRAHEQHKNDFMRKLQASTKLDDGKPPAGASVFISSKPPANAEPAVRFNEAFPKVVAVVHGAVTEMCQHACYKYTEAEPVHLNEESDEEYKRRAIGHYNEMKACLSDTISSIPKLIQDAYAIDIQSTEAEACSRKRKLEWIVPACDYWSDDENDEQSAPSKKSPKK